MKTSNSGISLIKEFEGLRLNAYKCPAGKWTIGYGHTNGVKQGDSINEYQAEEYLREDLKIFENHVLKYDNIYHFNQNQFDALVSFTYNCGPRNLKSLTQNGKRTIAQISKRILLYNKSGGVVLRGLQRRRVKEKILFDIPTKELKSYYAKYIGESSRVDEVLISIGANFDYDTTQSKPYLRRKPIAIANGINDYTGTATQNNKIIKLAKSGKLRRV